VGAEGFATWTVIVVVSGQALASMAPAGDAKAHSAVPALRQGATCIEAGRTLAAAADAGRAIREGKH